MDESIVRNTNGKGNVSEFDTLKKVNINNKWQDVDENHNCAFLPESYEYRIKPESK